VKRTVRPIAGILGSGLTVAMTVVLLGASISAVGVSKTKVTPTRFSIVGTTGIRSISCSNRNDCVALGSSKLSGLLVITERNGAWDEPMDFSNDFPDNDGFLDSISCAKSDQCLAGGFGFTKRNGANPMILWRHNGRWSVPHIPDLTMGGRMTQPIIESASCAPEGVCTAVGYGVLTGTHRAIGIAIAETDGRWTGPSPVPTSDREATQFAAQRLSCPASGRCVAAGDGVRNKKCCTEVVTESHGVWATPSFAADTLDGVENLHAYVRNLSCVATAGDCVLLEVYYTSNGSPEYFSVSEHDGVWSQGVPIDTDLSKRGYNLLYGLSCSSSLDCTAVGYKAISAGRFEALTERFMDGHWLPAHLVNPGGASDTSSSLDAVTCKASQCTAGGVATIHGRKTGIVLTFASES
jgi:hypothetical protein